MPSSPFCGLKDTDLCTRTPFFARLKEETLVSHDEVAGVPPKHSMQGGVCEDVAFCDLVLVADSGAEGQTARKASGKTT